MSTGKGTKSIRKSQQGNDIIPSVGFLNTVAKHKATLGQTVINLGSLTTPTEATSLGFAQPSGATLASMDLSRYKNNVTVSSTIRGLMDNPLDYRVTGQQQITLQVGAFENEIFTITIEAQPRVGTNIVAAQPKVSSYTLPAGETDIPTGPYTINANPGEDVGDFMVVVDRQLMYRNDSNGASGGDYQEIAGFVRLNDADLVNDRKVTLIWVGALVENPQDSQLALVQSLAGQIDAMIPTLAALAGVSETDFQAAPNDVDLAAFGAEVIDQASRITALEGAQPDIELFVDTGNGHGSTNTAIRRFSVVQKNTLGSYATYTDSATLGASVTILKGGLYQVIYTDTNTGALSSVGICVNGSALTTNINSVSYSQGRRAFVNASSNVYNAAIATLRLLPGDIVRPHSDGTVNSAVPATCLVFTRVGN